jgi:hypothetical protein
MLLGLQPDRWPRSAFALGYSADIWAAPSQNWRASQEFRRSLVRFERGHHRHGRIATTRLLGHASQVRWNSLCAVNLELKGDSIALIDGLVGLFRL